MKQISSGLNIRKIADFIEQIFLIGLFIWLCSRLLPDEYPPIQLYIFLLLLSEGFVLFFLVFRRRTERISLKFSDWFFAFAGTFTVYLIDQGGEALLPKVGATIVFVGMLIHLGAKLSLRRSIGLVPADRGVRTDGLYRFVRHPMYLGYFITHIGFLIAAPSLWNILIYALVWVFLILRVTREERLLSENPQYVDYIQKVNYRLLPKIF